MCVSAEPLSGSTVLISKSLLLRWRIQLPLPDGRHMEWDELVNELALANKQVPPGDVSFWRRFSRRAKAITRAGPDAVPVWAQKEWRYSRVDEDFDDGL